MWKKYSMPQADTAERLQKVLAAAGVGSRRACEDLIFRRRVTVNGRIAKLGDKVDPATAEIHVDGQRIITNTKLVYIAMNKPRGVVASLDDEKGRNELADFLNQFEQRLFHVGRLDADSEGLLLITNDGDLTNKLTHPRYGISKTYLAEVINGPLSRNVGRHLLAGVELEDGLAKADAFKLVGSLGKTAQVEIVLHEGRKHIVRRMLEAVGHPVTRLVRTAVGPIRLGDLRPGGFRHMSNAEIGALFKAAGDDVPDHIED
jgi:23S rRNA pseudouridine2605 synthase